VAVVGGRSGSDERGEAGAAAGEPVGSARGRHAAAQGSPLQRPRRGRRPGPLAVLSHVASSSLPIVPSNR
jgi:hypothetical protein